MARGKNLNRLLSIVLCIAMCTTLFPAAAFAEEAAPGDAAATSGELQPAESQPAESSAPESTQGNASDPVDVTGSASSAPDATVPEEVPPAETPAGAESAPESTASEETPPAETPAGAESAPEGTVPEKLPTVETSTSVESAPESTVPEAVPAEESAGVPVAYSDEVSPLSVGDTFTASGLTYKVTFAPYSGNNASVAVTRAEKTITVALIPATIENQGETFSVVNIGKGAFSGCNRLASVSIPGSLDWIETSAFENCTALVSITFPKGFGSIWDYAFAGCTGLKTVYFPETISYVGSGAFSGCTNLETVTFSPLCYGGNIGERAFSGCSSLSSITLPPSNFSVGAYAFEDCAALTSITYPKGLSQLQEGTFKNCTALRDVTVHHDVSSVGTRAFENCNNLSVVHFDGNAAQWNQIQIASDNAPLKNASVQYTTELHPLYYVLYGGTNNAANPAGYDETSDTIVLSAPTKTGYTFAGWYTDSSYTTKITQIAKGSTGEKTLYAKWEVATYPINYTLNGGNQNAKNPTGYTVDTADITLATPTRKGYNFAGWYTNSSFTTRVTTIPTGSTRTRNLYAKWNLATYKLTYVLDGGTQNANNPATYTFLSENITPASPTRKGCTFAGWYTSSAYTTRVTSIPSGSIGSRTLYAKWNLSTYPINYNLNGGNQNAANPVRYTVETEDIKLANPTRKGYNFGGWYLNSSFATRVTTIAKGSTGTRNLYAKWNLATYKLTYVLDGGTQNAPNPATYTFTTPSITLANPTRANYTFAGWYTSSAYTTKVTTIAAGSIGSKTLYAKWNAESYPINYTLNGGNQNAANPTSYTMATADITLANPSRKGYNFGGWYTSNAFTTRVTTIAKGSTGAKNLYAKWNLATYKLTYTLGGGTQNTKNPATYTFTTPSITLANPTRANYTFAGWYTSSAYTTKVTTIPTGSIGSRTLYAKWEAVPTHSGTCTNGGSHNYVNGICTICNAKDPDYKPTTSDDGVDCNAYSQEVFRLTNEARVANGLPALKYCSEYQSLADLRAQEASEFYSHTRPNGQPSYSVFDGYNGVQPMGENLIAGYPTPSGAVDAWLSSSGHYANMMNPKADGVIVSTSKLGTENNVTVQIFVQLDSNTGRIETSRDVIAPTCESQGNTIIHYDNNTFEAIDIVPALGHNFANGKCTRCGKNDPDFKYTYTETVVAPTCTELGYTRHTCNEDSSKSYDDDYCAPLGHNFVNGKCTRCGKNDSNYTPKYTYTVTVVAPTCDEEGYTHHSCNEDGTKSFTDSYVDALGHNYGSDGVCTRCGIVNGDDDGGDGDFGYSNNYDKTYFNNTIISDTNAARTQRGHAALRYASEYQAAADVRAQELVSSFSHTRPNGSQPFTALDEIGAKYDVFAENIAKVSYMYTPGYFVKGWINSPGHYTNMMADNIDAFVVGTAYDSSHYYAVQIFISDP